MVTKGKRILENQQNIEESKEKFECMDCGCYFWVKDRDNFKCPNCN